MNPSPRATRAKLLLGVKDPIAEAFSELTCATCAAPQPSGVGMVHPEVHRSLDDVVRQARWLVEAEADRIRKRGSSCEVCRGRLAFSRLHLHRFHAARREDLVVTMEASGAHSLSWWALDGTSTPAQPSADEVRALLRQECVKALAVNSTMKLPDLTIESFRRAVDLFPDDEEVVGLLPSLVTTLGRRGYTVAHELARKLVARAPDQPLPKAILGSVLLQGWGDELAPQGNLAEAVATLEEAVTASGPAGHLGAELTLCHALRQQKRDPEARAGYARLLERHPGCAQAHYNLGILELDSCTASLKLGADRPLRDVTEASTDALARFDAGAALEPKDPDFQVGRARALLKLERFDEAGAAARRARELGSRHERLTQVEVELERHLRGDAQGELGSFRIQTMGQTIHGEGITEQGTEAIVDPADIEGQAQRFVESFSARLGFVKSVALLHGPGTERRFFVAMGNGTACRAQLAPSEQADAFQAAFDARWAALGKGR